MKYDYKKKKCVKAAVKEAAENLFTANFGLIRVTKVRRTGSYKKKKIQKKVILIG